MTRLMNTYARLPVAFARGEGVWLWDTQGKRYLDGLSGIAVTGVGRGRGLMIGIELEQPCSALVERGLQNGLLVNVTAEAVLRLLPPLIMHPTEAGLLADGTAALIRAWIGESVTQAS